MKLKTIYSTVAAAMALALCLSFSGCGEKKAPVLDDEVTVDASEQALAVAGGEVTLPETFVVPQEAGLLNTEFVENKVVGAIALSRYKTTTYFTTSGTSIDVVINGSLYEGDGKAAVTKSTETSIALWKQVAGAAQYVTTMTYTADGTTQTATFNNLEAGAKYRVAVTYSARGGLYFSGTFNINGVASQSAEDDSLATAAAA